MEIQKCSLWSIIVRGSLRIAYLLQKQDRAEEAPLTCKVSVRKECGNVLH